MNALSFFFGFLFLVPFVQLNAQEASTSRTISAADQLALQKSEVDNFQNQLYRFQTALEDLDQETVATMAQVLVELMEEECQQNSSNTVEIAEQKKSLLKTVKDYSFSQTDMGDISFKEVIKSFKEFHAILKDEIEPLKD